VKLRIVLSTTVRRALVRYLFLVLAIACLGVYGYAYLERAMYQTWESREFDRARERTAPVVTSSSGQIKPISRVVRPLRKPLPWSDSSSAVIGRLSVPRLHLSAMVREGTDGKTLRLAIGHISSTALPGQAGNVGVAGHRDSFFRRLKDLKNGDEIDFSTLHGDFKYVVESLVVVEPDDLAVLAPSSDNVLTMVTCYPFFYIGNAPKRFVARARQVLPETLATVE